MCSISCCLKQSNFSIQSPSWAVMMLSHHRASELSSLKQNLTALIEKDRLFWDVSDVITGIRNQDFGFWSVCLGGSGLVVTRLFLGLYAKWKSVFCKLQYVNVWASCLYIICDRLYIYMFLYYIIISFIYYLYFNVILYRSLSWFLCLDVFSWYLVLHNCFEKAMFNEIVFMFFPSRWWILRLYTIMVSRSMYNLYNNHNDV